MFTPIDYFSLSERERTLIEELCKGNAYIYYEDEYIFFYERMWYIIEDDHIFNEPYLNVSFSREIIGKILLGAIHEVNVDLKLIDQIEDFYVLDFYEEGMVYKKDKQYYLYMGIEKKTIPKSKIVHMMIKSTHAPYIRTMTCEEVEDIM